MSSPCPSTAPLRVLVGTSGEDTGVHVFDLVADGDRPTLVPTCTVAGIAAPSYLTEHPSRPIVFAVSETDAGQIVEVRTEGAGAWSTGRRVPSHGDGPCHVGTDGEHLFVANYGSGSAAGYTVRPDGGLGEHVWNVRHQMTHRRDAHARQDAPHAHCAVIDPRHPSVHVVDLGTDRVVRYAIDDLGGIREAGDLAVPAGAGPRHLVFHPTAPRAYLVCELDCTLVALEVLDPHGDLVILDTLPTLPVGAPPSLAAAVVVHPDGHRVYVSNRGDDSIAVFVIDDPDRPLTPLTHVPSGGRAPRDLAIDPSGRMLLAANQGSGEINGFVIDDDGIPVSIGVLAQVAEPACVLVLPAALEREEVGR